VNLLTRIKNQTNRKTPLLMQKFENDCGMACLMMIAQHFDCCKTKQIFDRQWQAASNILSIEELVKYAGRIGLMSKVTKLNHFMLLPVSVPSILYWNSNHFVVLTDVTIRNITIHDPAKGRLSLNWATVEQEFSNVCIEFSITMT